MPFPGDSQNTLGLWSIPGATTNRGASAANATNGSRPGSSTTSFAPGQGAIFTPDPTVNGPWTHTDASIPLFRPLPAAPAPAPAPGGGTTRPVPTAGKPSWPRPSTPPQPPTGTMGPRKPDRQMGSMNPKRRRDMLADILSRD